jgi:serine/threonine protein kinase
MSDPKLEASSSGHGASHRRVLAGRYELEGELGRGGMAVVHRARDLAEGREVALKLLLDPNGKDRFLSEARKTAQIRHPNVVTVYETGQDGTDTLPVHGAARRRDARAAAAARQGARASRCGPHRCRDLRRARGVPRARDGPPRHQAEQCLPRRGHGERRHDDQGHRLRHREARRRNPPSRPIRACSWGRSRTWRPSRSREERSMVGLDLYALGVMLYQMLSGRLPFLQDTAASLIHAHLTAPPPDLPNAGHSKEHARLNAVGEGAAREVARGPAARRGRRARCDPRRRRRGRRAHGHASPLPPRARAPERAAAGRAALGAACAALAGGRSGAWRAALRPRGAAELLACLLRSAGSPAATSSARPLRSPELRAPLRSKLRGPSRSALPASAASSRASRAECRSASPATRSSCSSSARCSSASARISWQRSGRSRSSASLRTPVAQRRQLDGDLGEAVAEVRAEGAVRTARSRSTWVAQTTRTFTGVSRVRRPDGPRPPGARGAAGPGR